MANSQAALAAASSLKISMFVQDLIVLCLIVEYSARVELGVLAKMPQMGVGALGYEWAVSAASSLWPR